MMWYNVKSGITNKNQIEPNYFKSLKKDDQSRKLTRSIRFSHLRSTYPEYFKKPNCSDSLNPIDALSMQVNENLTTKRIMDQVFASGSPHISPFVKDMAKSGLSAAWLVKPGTFIRPSNSDPESILTFWNEDSDHTIDLSAKTLEVY